MALSKDAILSASDRALQEVDIPEWGGSVFIRPMSGADRDSFEGEVIAIKDGNRMANLRARTAVRVVCDEKGERLFTDADLEALTGKSASALDRIFTASMRISKIGDSEVETLGKSLEVGQTAVSGSV